MKKYILLFALGLFINVLSAQKLQLQDGKAYKNGELFTGVDVTFFDDGISKKEEANYHRGLKNGTEYLYYKNGQLKAERIWKKGLKDGVWKNWDEDGNKTAEASYSKNIKDGDWIIWSSDGIKLFEMHYSKGKKTGKWYQWNEQGELIMEKEF